MKQHKWHNIIQAWLNGEAIQWRNNPLRAGYTGVWYDCHTDSNRMPNFNSPDHQFRIKPAKIKVKYIRVLHVTRGGRHVISVCNSAATLGISRSRPSYIKTIGTWITEEIDLEA